MSGVWRVRLDESVSVVNFPLSTMFDTTVSKLLDEVVDTYVVHGVVHRPHHVRPGARKNSVQTQIS